MRLKKTIAAKILVVLLIYVFTADNISGELALCIGSHWHIALEPLTHEHNENHSHIENDPSSTEHEHDGHVESPHCKPCIDIPIFIGSTDTRLLLKPARPNSNTHASIVEPITISDSQLILPIVPRRFSSTLDENRFLRSIILLV
jgi:hypothetical protein